MRTGFTTNRHAVACSEGEPAMADEETPAAKPTRKTRAAKRPTKKKVGARRTRLTTVPAGPWTFPKHTLERAIEVAQALEEKNAGKPLKSADLVPLLGFKRVQDGDILNCCAPQISMGLCKAAAPPQQLN